MVWWKLVAFVVAFLLGVGVSAPALGELNATWVDKAVAASQSSPTEDSLSGEAEDKSKVTEETETPEAVTATPGIQSGIATVVPAVETNLETTVTPVAEWPEGGFTGETTVTYNANGKGSFEGGATTNVVMTKYDGFEDVTKYSHTDNLDDAGEVAQNGGYGNNKSFSRVVTIPGASSLTVDITYQTEGTSYDWVCAYAGGTESSPVGDAQCSTSLTGKLGGTTKTTKSFTVDGDSVTFWFRSDGSGSNYYGYYAVVKGLVGSRESVSGTYAAPVDPSGEYKLSSWNTKPDGTGENLGAGEVYSRSNQTVYAQWSLGSNYTKWGTVGWKITDDGTLKIRPWEGDIGTTGAVTHYSSDVPWYSQRSKIKKVESTGTIMLNASSDWLFFDCSNLTDISAIADWNVSNVTNMSSMFSNCSSLADLSSLASWNVSNVTDMSSMFSNCSKLTDLTPLTSWNVSNVTSMNSMFSYCSSLTALIPLTDWDMSKVMDMRSMFSYCSSLTDLTALTSWNVSKVTNMGTMFRNCSSLTDLTPLKSWNVSKVTSMSYMFDSCSNLTDLTSIADWDVSNVTNMAYMFSGCSRLTDLTGLENWNVPNVTDMSSMFLKCSNLTNLAGLENWDVSNVMNMSAMFSKTAIESVDTLSRWDVSNVKYFGKNDYYRELYSYYSYGMFESCFNLSDISGLSNWVTSSAINMCSMFKNCPKLNSIDSLSNWDVRNVKYMGGYFGSYPNGAQAGMFFGCSGLSDITAFKSWNVSNVTNMGYMFYNCSSLTNLTGLTSWNVFNVINMESMFSGCSNLTNLTGLENWNVSKVTDMNSMFSRTGIEGVDPLSHWDVSNVKYFGKEKSYFESDHWYSVGMFESCSNLSDISGLSSWVTSSAINMRSMFRGCSKLSNIDPLSNWDVRTVKYLGGYYDRSPLGMFAGCSGLSGISALEDWNVSNVTDMSYIFAGCPNLVDISGLASWSVSKVTTLENAFFNCRKLADITALESWNVSNVTTMRYMFGSCYNITDITALVNWDVSKVRDMFGMFTSCSNLTDLTAFANWNVSKVTEMRSMFNGCPNLQKVGIPSIVNGGQNLLNKANDANLTRYMPTIITEDFTMGPYSWNQLKSEMQTNPDAFQEGTVWVRYTPSYFLDFNPNGGIGSTKSLMTPLAGTATLPDSTFLRFGYKFIGWTTQPDPVSDMNPLMKPGQQFRPESPTDAARYTLYAQWEKLGDTSNLPKSSQSGILPGWVQVGSENTNGLIPPMDMAIASFINKYSPDQTSITFRFLKLLDGNVPSASDTFTFDIYDKEGKLVQTATNVGSTIAFAPLGFSKAGVFTYFISERQDSSNKINEDDNVIQATVTVVEEDGKLKATAQLLGDTTFRNETKPAELIVSKKVVLPEWSDITDDDQKTFKFNVTLRKDNSPLSGTFDGVTFDGSGTATIEVKGNAQKAIKGIPAGTAYTVDEVDMPQGYFNTDKTNTNGNLLADSSVTSEWENTYTPVDATAQLQASKKYFDQSNTEFNLKGGEFGFSACEIIDSNTSAGCVTATNDRTGKVEFPVLTYSTPGIHAYRITEDVTSTDKSIAFDRNAYTVTVEVADNGEGSLVSNVQYNTADGSVPVFVNRNSAASALPQTGGYAVWAVVFAAVVSVVWFAAPGRRRLR